MKKRRAITFFGGFTVLLLSYFAWCVSPFFRQPDILISDGLPPDWRTAVQEWRPYKHPISEGNQTVMREIMRNLANPYKVDRYRAFVSFGSDRYFSFSAGPFNATIVRRNGKWVWERASCHEPAM